MKPYKLHTDLCHLRIGSFSVKSASEGVCLIAKRIVGFLDDLIVKTWWVAAAELITEKVTLM